jgi:uncharacterized surface protein with fasciclin (FAS1) repeats
MRKLLLVIVGIFMLTLAVGSASARRPGQTIAEIAGGDPNFSILAGALSATGLLSTFEGNRQFTVFAPTNSAFESLAAALGADTFNAIVSDADCLSNILLYHAAPGRRNANAILGARQVRMLNGDFAAVNASAVTIANAPIVQPNIQASNGIIHVVGAVLIPPSLGRFCDL